MSLYGIGIEALIEIWIEREKQILSRYWYAHDAHLIAKMRRELQEAAGLVADPEGMNEGTR